MSIKFLHVINSMDPSTGGPCQGIRNIDKASREFGISREVVSLDEPTASFIGMDSFPIHALGPGKGPWQYSAKLIPWLNENLTRFDVIIVNGLWLYHSYAAWKVMRNLKKNGREQSSLPKIFAMPHGMLDPWFQKAKGRELKALRNWLYWKLIENKVVNDVDGLLFTCETELLLARTTFTPYHPKREINVGYGIEEPSFFSNSMQEAFIVKCPEVRDQPFLLFLSRIHYKKGVDLLVNAYAELVQERLETGADILKLVIAGPGLDTPYGKTILNQVARNPQLKDRIFFTGMLTGDAKWGAINSSEAFILPSHQENFGIAVVEAMSYGKPVLISNQVNIWREIESGGGGMVAENSLAGTLQLLQQWSTLSPANKKIMSKKAKAVFEQHFAIKPVAVRFAEATSS